MQPEKIPIEIEIEPSAESGGFCDCCGSESRTIWGYVHQAERTLACYYIQWTVGASLETHPANIDLIYGAWGDGTTERDRCLIAMINFENEDGSSIMVIDADTRLASMSDVAGSAMKRSDIVGTPFAPHVFRIIDAIFTQDPRL